MGNKSIPELRFPKFIKSWNERKIGELYNVYSGQTPSRSDPSNFDKPSIAWIKTTDLNNGRINENNEDISVKAAKRLRLLNENTVLIAMYGGFNQIGRTGLLTYPATINQALSALEPIDEINPYFLITELNYRIQEWRKLAASSRKDPNITKNDVEGFILFYPSLQEQIKIGTFFKEIDDLINRNQQKLTTLKQTKQGFLQKMFPKEGETVPEVRFPGFSGDWDEHCIGDLSETTFGGGTPKTTIKEYWNGNIPWIQSSDLSQHKLSGIKPNKKITEIGLENSATKIIPKQSIAIVTRVGVGKIALIEEEYSTSQDFISLSNLKINTWFAVYSLYGLLQKELHKVQGTSIKGITKKELLDKKIRIPFNKNEQTQIGKFFKQLDETIAFQEQELETLKQTKQAFLQKMFF